MFFCFLGGIHVYCIPCELEVSRVPIRHMCTVLSFEPREFVLLFGLHPQARCAESVTHSLASNDEVLDPDGDLQAVDLEVIGMRTNVVPSEPTRTLSVMFAARVDRNQIY